MKKTKLKMTSERNDGQMLYHCVISATGEVMFSSRSAGNIRRWFRQTTTGSPLYEAESDEIELCE